ncbi:molybdopterin molybdotransferase MoeA [Occallatibacter savannae]|uniref:molybdopterin molybdotransferase MoeA n=1 Tax=Occallatibacter savannae TaxID=1002691 RepID=UPI000D694C5D|nr:molybdopterin molybdotransferase MoeA [Occallatibacter savannae]
MPPDLLSYEQAASLIAENARAISESRRPSIERIDLAAAPGRILATPLLADDDQPPFPRSTRDGYACRADELSAHVPLPIAGSTRAGQPPASPLPPSSAWEIMTGAPVPSGADCVVMLEHVEESGNTIQLSASRTIAQGDNIVSRGAQSRRGDQILSAGFALGPAQIALAASCGYSTVEVFRRPRVAILTTGDELVPVDATPGPGQIRNSNAPMLAALVARCGADPLILPTAADSPEALDAALAQAATADLLLISGGVSAGTHDLVEPALARRGAQFHFTGVKIQPGKPLVFGQIPQSAESQKQDKKHQGKTSVVPTSAHTDERASASRSNSIPFFGLPGNPISSAATFLLFAAPILAALSGSRETHPRFVLAQLARDTDRKAKPGLTRFLPALCTFNRSANALPQVATIPWHGSGDLTAFAQSNCFLVIPEDAAHLDAGSTVRILLH